ncbi:hypothetical protein BACI349Y_640112 [Bacillus sp. 349Y]|nr:hypothetical protein BACI349Y_640112 [Bacillus sp. 349Y]
MSPAAILVRSVLIEELVRMDELFYVVSELPVYYTL